MYQYIVQSSVTSKTTHNLSHIDTTNTIQQIQLCDGMFDVLTVKRRASRQIFDLQGRVRV